MDIKKELEIMKEIEAANKRHVEEWKKQQEADKMLAVFVDVYGTGRVKKVRIRRDLDEYYRLLKCTTVDMPFRWIGGKQFVFICDDEGAFRKDCKPSARNGDEVMLVGNLLVVAFDGHEDIRGLTEDEVKHIMKHVTGLGRMDKRGAVDIWSVLTDVTYMREG